MEFDSLSGYNNMTTPAPIPTGNVRVQPKNAESAETDTSASSVAETMAQDSRINNKAENSAADKYGRERNDQNNAESALAKAIESANKKLVGTNYGFQYSVHEKTKLVMIKVVNSETKETVREVPPQKHLDAIAKMWELAGILVDEKR